MKRQSHELMYIIIAIGLILFGLVLLFTGSLFENNVEIAVGAAIIGGAVVSLMFETTTLRHLVRQLAESVHSIREASQILNCLDQVGIESVYRTTDSKEAQAAFDDCLNDLKACTDKTVRYLEVVIRTPLRRGTGFFARMQTEILERFPEARLHLLLIDPNSEDAIFRGKLDKIAGTTIDLFEEIRSSVFYCLELISNHPNQVKLSFYKRHPMARIFLTPNWVLYQPFHLGERKGVIISDTVRRAVGAMPIILKCKVGSEIYALADNQFKTYEKGATYIDSKETAINIISSCKARWRSEGFVID
jgi:hypothetical protein